MDTANAGPVRTLIATRILPRRHTVLLLAIIAAFAVRPLIGDGSTALLLFSVAMLVLLMVALYTIQVDELAGERDVLLRQRKRRSIVGWALAVPAVADRVLVVFAPTKELYLLGALSWLAFCAFVTWSELRTLLKHKEVTTETISTSVSVYLMLALTWGLIYIALDQLQPNAFHFAAASAPSSPSEYQKEIFPILIYFSLTTISTIGFGDITPMTLQTRYAAVAEGIAGQFYLAILVARLVGMHMSQSMSSDPTAPPPTSQTGTQ